VGDLRPPPRANKGGHYIVREKRTELIAEEESETILATVVRWTKRVCRRGRRGGDWNGIGDADDGRDERGILIWR